MKFLNFFLLLWVIFALLDPLTTLNPGSNSDLKSTDKNNGSRNPDKMTPPPPPLGTNKVPNNKVPNNKVPNHKIPNNKVHNNKVPK